MTNADGERIAPVTYLFGARPNGEDQSSADEKRSASPSVVTASTQHEPATAPTNGPVFVDLGDPGAADERVAAVRAELEAEARSHVSRSSREAAEASGSQLRKADREKPERPKKGAFDPINNVSMHALARRGMSSREMRDYLIGREFESVEVDTEVERLESVALLDDVLLAETLVRQLRDRKGFGRSALTGELRRRHLDPLAIEMALEALDDDELERATEIAHKRASQLRSYDAETAKRRLGAFLMRKGYSGSVVSTAVQRALAPAGPTFR